MDVDIQNDRNERQRFCTTVALISTINQNIMDILKTNYCRLGLGKGSSGCQQREPAKPIKQNGPGPDVSAEISKARQCSCQADKLTLLIPDWVNSKEKLSKFIQEQGHKRGSPEYLELYREYSKNLKSECEYL